MKPRPFTEARRSSTGERERDDAVLRSLHARASSSDRVGVATVERRLPGLKCKAPAPAAGSGEHQPRTPGNAGRGASATRLKKSSIDGFGRALLHPFALQEGRDVGADARRQVLQRYEAAVREPQAVPVEAGLALRERGLNFRADSVGRLHGDGDVGQDDLGVALHANRDPRIAWSGEANGSTREARRHIELALTRRARTIHFEG